MRRLGRKLSGQWAKLRPRLIPILVFCAFNIYRPLPARFVFAFLVLIERSWLPGKTLLKQAFVPISSRLAFKHPNSRLGSWFTRLMPMRSASVLHDIGAHREFSELLAARGLEIPRKINLLRARSLFELGEFERAREVLDLIMTHDAQGDDPPAAHFTAQIELLSDKEAEALGNLEIGVRGMPHILCPHQNLAARNSASYQPHALDALCGRDGRLFDAYNYLGQRVTHVGEGQLSTSLYSAGLEAQKRLRQVPPNLSKRLRLLLAKLDIEFKELRILAVEWYAQVGHQGMLDMLFRMRDLGWWEGKVVFLLPHRMVANPTFQRLFDGYGHVLMPGVNIDFDVAAELFSLQRWCGMSFNAFELPDGQVVPWQQAGAQMIVRWEREGRGFPVRDEFDRTYGVNGALRASFARVCQRWGMKPDDWYVCLHMRDALHYGEISGTGQTHRNADVDEYLSAIRHITSLGGWVIKLGGPRSPKLPRMRNVVDYARSYHRSHLMDVQLIRNARLFIGTTSGLTNVAVSMGIHCALVNCITTDAQLWGDRVRFALKGIKLQDGSFITQQQITSTPWRWRMFSADVLARHGAILVDNTSDEILEIVKEVEALVAAETYATVPDGCELLARWRSSLSIPHFYGNALPSLYYLKKHPSFLQQSQPPAPPGTAEPSALRVARHMAPQLESVAELPHEG
jgi:putative glycosyltransferase (TIGR04372 family)